MAELQGRLGIAYLFISHDLNLVRTLSHQVAVMYLGRIVEEGPVDALYATPHHPYTQALLSASPTMDPTRRRQRIVLEGDIPSPLDPPSGCRFRTRCRYAMDVCATAEPRGQGVDGLTVRCYLTGSDQGMSGTGQGMGGSAARRTVRGGAWTTLRNCCRLRG